MKHSALIISLFFVLSLLNLRATGTFEVDYSIPKGTPTATMTPGDIKLFQLKGKASYELKEGEPVPLKRGQVIQQGGNIITEELSSVVIMFSNGTTANIGASTKLELIQYMQDPFDKSQGIYTRLKEDPSASLTHMMVHRGEVLLTVKKLHKDSILDLVSPIGSAGCRGTTYHTSYGINKLTGNPLMAVANLDGEVIIESQIEAELIMSDNSVAAGKYNPYVGPKLYEIPEKAIVLLEADPEVVPELNELPPLTPVSDFEDILTQIESQIEELQSAITQTAISNTVILDPFIIPPGTGTVTNSATTGTTTGPGTTAVTSP